MPFPARYDDLVDDDEEGPDHCHHGVPFTTDCDDCTDEDALDIDDDVSNYDANDGTEGSR